jgi:hypothetical protein
MGNNAQVQHAASSDAGDRKEEKESISPLRDDSTDDPASPIKRESQKKSSKKIDADVDTDDAIEILFQFIPFYGQGDASNDSIVRSTLSDLPVEDIDRRDQYGNTLLLAACQYRCEALVRIMLNKGADPNSLNSAGASCLHFACYKESMSKSIAKALLQNGANPEVSETTYGCTPLHYCAGTGDVEFCKMLVSYGAVVGTCDYYNYTSVDYAREAGMTEVATFLQKKMLMTSSMGAMSFSAARGGGTGAAVGAAAGGLHRVSSMASASANSPAKSVGPAPFEDEWTENLDPTTGGKYFVNLSSGECLWESDYLRKKEAAQYKPSAPPADDILDGITGISRVDSREEMPEMPETYSIDIFTPNAPAAKKAKGSSVNLPGQLLSSNSLSHIAGSFSGGSQTPIKSGGSATLKSAGAPSPSGAVQSPSHTSTVDAIAMQRALQEAKEQAEESMQKERLAFNTAIAERDGRIAKLEAEHVAFAKERERVEVFTVGDCGCV